MHRAGPAELVVKNRVATVEAAKIRQRMIDKAKGHIGKAASVAATEWVSLGPTNAPKEFNYFEIPGVDSGRPNSIVVDPRDGNIVYVAVSGGGVWKTFNFLAADGPTWSPIGDTLPNLAAGALAIDPARPNTLYLGSGDFIDASGNTIFKSTDGGSSWGAPVVLDGKYPGDIPAKVNSVRQIGVDGKNVYAATNAGLFKSTDGGATFALVDLPNANDLFVTESLWSIVPIGGGGWVAGGITACDVGQPPPGVFGSDRDPGFCPLGNNLAIWRSDDGETWQAVTTPDTTGIGRSQLASGPTDDPAHTVIYAYIGGVYGEATKGFWRSKDGGKTWVDATGALANPTLVDQNGDDTCLSIDVGHGQTWYNQAIVVDPTDADHVLVGGNLCGMRTLNGTADAPVWENVSHWLPGPGYGETANGRLPYVHADWHTATSVVINGAVRTFAGTDGGVFSSSNLFDPATSAESVVWSHHNRGLATHLFYSVASGDPATANPFVLFGGLQDNGTRFRADPQHPSEFNQAIGGDGIGATVHASTAGTVYWASVQFAWAWCKPALTDCSVETPMAQTEEEAHWHGTPSPVGLEPEEIAARAEARAKKFGDDQEPFLVHYANVETDTTGPSVLTHSDEQVFVAIDDGAGGFTWKSISQDLTSSPIGAGIKNVTASRTIPGLYGAVGAVSAEPFYVTTQGNTKVDWTVAQPVHPLGDDVRLTGASSIDFRPGSQAGQEFIGAFVDTMNDPDRTPPPDDKGRLWRTKDGGQTWTSIVGADPAHRLPNVPVYVVKYDPITPMTIYAGTDLGVYITTDDAVTWNRMGDGFPMVPVRDMYVAKNQEFIRVATYGRGLWEIYPSADASHGAAGNGDYDRNVKLDWIDLAAMSSRLGVTPATTTKPLYSWIMDISGAGSDPPVQAIDGADFDALLANFGGHP
ncbi:MAG: hypothetical protein K8W52_05905 [Deltaproteobacteria bacterium]|nr:hypothetical protein [Deltaproteobacteria bacterium]